jgi:hypothetical protein
MPDPGAKPSRDPAFTVLPGGGFAAPSAPPPPATISEMERPAIEASIREYAKALSSKDLSAVARVRKYTPAEADNWKRYFKFSEYRLIVKVVGPPVVDGDRATIPVEEQIAQTQRRGDIQTFLNPRKIDYKLEKIAGKWMILPPG